MVYSWFGLLRGISVTDCRPFPLADILLGESYSVIRQGNNLDIMSSVKVQINHNENLSCGFKDSQNKAYGENSMADLGDGKFVMIAYDGNADGVVSVLDYSTVANSILSRGFAQGDMDMNGVMNVLDYSFISKNLFRKTNLP